VICPAAGFDVIASSANAPIAAMASIDRSIYGIQFHPEVTHTVCGEAILQRFVKTICQCDGLWTPANIVEDAIARVKKQIGDEQVLLALSGGVDSSVVATLLHKAVGSQLTCVFVDTKAMML